MFPANRFVSRVLAVPLVLVAALVLSACGNAAPTTNTAATVAGTSISTDQLHTTASVFTAVAALQQQPCGQLDGATDTQEAACNRASLSSLIRFLLAEDYAKAHGIEVSDKKVETAFKGFEQNAGAEVLATELTANGVGVDDVRELIRLSLLQNAAMLAIAEERLNDDDLRAQYESSLGQFTTLHVDHILVDSEAKAEDVYRQVTAPGFSLADFQALAKEISIDPNAATDGGELTLAASQLVPEFANAALALSPGEISQPVKTQYGWHVIWKIDQTVTPFDQARDQIIGAAQNQQFGLWIGEQDAAGRIEVDPSFGRFDDQQLAVVRITSTDPSATATPSGAVNGVTPSP